METYYKDYFCLRCQNQKFRLTDITMITHVGDINCPGYECTDCAYQLLETVQMDFALKRYRQMGDDYYKAICERAAFELDQPEPPLWSLDKNLQAQQEKQGNSGMVSKNDSEA